MNEKRFFGFNIKKFLLCCRRMTFILTAEQETLELSTIQHTPDKKRLLQKMCILQKDLQAIHFSVALHRV